MNGSYLIPAIMAIVAMMISSIIVSIPLGIQPPTMPDDSPLKSLQPWAVFSPRMLLHRFFLAGVRATSDPKQYILELVTSYYKSEVVYMLLRHEILEVLDGSSSCHEVATLLQLQAHAVCEYLKAGEKLGLVSEDSAGEGIYRLTAAGVFLRGNHQESLRNVGLFLNEETRDAWRAASTQSTVTGKSGWQEAFGLEYAVWFQNSRGKAKLMRQAQMAAHNIEAGSVLGDWKPTKLDSVFCDIGGGVGDMLVSILQHYPNMTGIVMDKTYLSGKAVELFDEHKLSRRATFLGGYFFAPTLPKLLKRCDVFFLKHILSEFDDQKSVEILEKVKAVAKPSARVVIVERILQTNSFEIEKALESVSLLASSGLGAKDRSLRDYKALLIAAGFMSNPSYIPLRGVLSILEITD